MKKLVQSCEAYERFGKPTETFNAHVFLRQEALKPAIGAAYRGPFAVLKCTQSTATTQFPTRQEVVSFDRLEPAFLEAFL